MSDPNQSDGESSEGSYLSMDSEMSTIDGILEYLVQHEEDLHEEDDLDAGIEDNDDEFEEWYEMVNNNIEEHLFQQLERIFQDQLYEDNENQEEEEKEE